MKFLTLVAALVLWAPLTHAQLVDNDEGLFELANRDTRGMQVAAIHADNLADLSRVQITDDAVTERAEADVQRILDLSIGAFRDDFASRAGDFIATAQKGKSVTKGAVTAAALESAGDDSAVVLVAATSQVTNASGARDDPRPWRMSVTVSRDEDQWKMSNVEFVP
jgi:Mce-associated membrane protein